MLFYDIPMLLITICILYRYILYDCNYLYHEGQGQKNLQVFENQSLSYDFNKGFVILFICKYVACMEIWKYIIYTYIIIYLIHIMGEFKVVTILFHFEKTGTNINYI